MKPQEGEHETRGQAFTFKQPIASGLDVLSHMVGIERFCATQSAANSLSIIVVMTSHNVEAVQPHHLGGPPV